MLNSVNTLTCSRLTFFSELWEFHNIKTGGFSLIFSPLMSNYSLKKTAVWKEPPQICLHVSYSNLWHFDQR